MSPPTRSTDCEMSVARARSAVPLNSRCSRKWLTPATCDGSSRAPTPIQTPIDAVRVELIGSTATVNPDGRSIDRIRLRSCRTVVPARPHSAMATAAAATADRRRGHHRGRRHGHGRHGHGRDHRGRRPRAGARSPGRDRPARSPARRRSSPRTTPCRGRSASHGCRCWHRCRPRGPEAPLPSPPAADSGRSPAGTRLTLPRSSISSTVTSISSTELTARPRRR